MMRWIKNSKKGMAVLGAVAFMLVAGWQFGVSGTEAVFSETEVALEKAIAGSGNDTVCYNSITSLQGSQVRYCPSCTFIDGSKASWYSPKSNC